MGQNPRADALIAQYTDDPKLIEEIYQHMADFQAGKTSLAEIIANYTSDPVLTATIKQYVAKTQGGFSPASLTAFGEAESRQASSAASTAEANKGVTEHIVTEHS
jgi:hypothetical protein